mmetsp:Transcript_34112/g.85965  ORF Transcript_34112/g.85965 Transcript_34112/m.85965 type:complete len:83 (+) Transcript_34112:2034-2282(+)
MLRLKKRALCWSCTALPSACTVRARVSILMFLNCQGESSIILETKEVFFQLLSQLQGPAAKSVSFMSLLTCGMGTQFLLTPH